MKSNSNLGKKIVVGVALLVLAGLLSLATAPADQPLSKDDITLLLLGSSPSSKIIQMVEQRGVDFQMNPDLAKKFHDQGASDDLIDALQKAGNKAAAAKASAPALPLHPRPRSGESQLAPAAPEPSPEGKPNAPDAPEPRAAEPPPAARALRLPRCAIVSREPVLHTRHSAASAPRTCCQQPPAPAPRPARSSSSSEPVLHQACEEGNPPETPAWRRSGSEGSRRARNPAHHPGICRQGEDLSRGPQQLHLPPDQQS